MADVGRTGQCVVHHDRPAVTRCTTCHKPVCQECVVSTTDGKFCSRKCAERAADFRASKGKGSRGGLGVGSILRIAIGVLILIVGLGLVNRFIFRIPVIGGALDRIPFIGAGGGENEQKARDTLKSIGDKASEALDAAKQKAEEMRPKSDQPAAPAPGAPATATPPAAPAPAPSK